MKYDTLLKLLGALRVRELPDNSKRKFVSRKLSTVTVDFVLLQCAWSNKFQSIKL